MRLYIKLFAIILAAAGVQQLIDAGDSPSEVWFGLRCSFAYVIHDESMIASLVEEARGVNLQPPIRVSAAGGG